MMNFPVANLSCILDRQFTGASLDVFDLCSCSAVLLDKVSKKPNIIASHASERQVEIYLQGGRDYQVKLIKELE